MVTARRPPRRMPRAAPSAAGTMRRVETTQVLTRRRPRRRLTPLVALLGVSATGCFDLDRLDRCAREVCPSPCVAKTVAGWSHTCALKADRSLWCWGSNNAVQLGTGKGSELPMANTPQKVLL